jgi:hypothetical protein
VAIINGDLAQGSANALLHLEAWALLRVIENPNGLLRSSYLAAQPTGIVVTSASSALILTERNSFSADFFRHRPVPGAIGGELMRSHMLPFW